MSLCDAGTPFYSAIDYDRNKIVLEQEPPEPPAYKPPEKPEPPETKTPPVPKTPQIELPSKTRSRRKANPTGPEQSFKLCLDTLKTKFKVLKSL